MLSQNIKVTSTAGLEPAREITMGFESIPLTTRARRPFHVDTARRHVSVQNNYINILAEIIKIYLGTYF